MLISRTDPFTPFRSIDRTFDELVATALRPARARRPVPFAFDAAWQDGDLVVTVDLPGVPDDAIAVAVADRTLTVSVNRPAAEGVTTEERSLRLGNALDPSGVSAKYEYGRLTITVPSAKAPEARAVPIEVTRGSAEVAPAIEAEASVPEADADTA
ncbi:MAG: Hsp20/alpha crystallin family protein [Acidimicrobiia bacterium]